MMLLKLTIKKKWFDMILSGDKKTEYRDINIYWLRRFTESSINTMLLFDQFKSSGINDEKFLKNRCRLQEMVREKYTHIQFFNGRYFGSELPNFKIKITGFYIGSGVEDWGAENGKEYFSFCLGQIEEKHNC